METTIRIDDRALQNNIKTALLMLGPQGGKGLMSAIGQAMKRSTLDKFKGETDGTGPWEPLADSTIAGRKEVRKARHEYNKSVLRSRLGRRQKYSPSERAAQLGAIAGMVKILDDTSWLRNHIESRADATSAEIGTDVFYGVFHQTGTVHMPERAFLTVTLEDEGRIDSLVDRYLQRVFP